MLVFPQLSTGATAQFPLSRTRGRRTVVNRLADGSSLRYACGGGGTVEWDLPLVGLTNAEAAKLEALYEAAEGRLRTFLFLDPASNLLVWSEDFRKPAWKAGPMLQITPGIADPMDASRASRVVNAGQSAQSLVQTLPLPGGITYTLSIYARSQAGGNIVLFSTAGARSAIALAADGAWQRAVLTTTPTVASPPIGFGVELAAGQMAELFGIQLEAQPAPSGYMMTESASGLYSRARFAQDEFSMTTQGPDDVDVHVRIVSPDGN